MVNLMLIKMLFLVLKLVVNLEEMNSLVQQLNERYEAISKAMGN